MDPLRTSTPFVPPRAGRPAAREEVSAGPEDGFTLSPLRAGVSSPAPGEAFELVHPGTAAEFRPVLDEALALLPWSLVQGIAGAGYRLHVVDTQGEHEVTLELEEGWEGAVEEHRLERDLAEVAAERGTTVEAVLALNGGVLRPGAPVRLPGSSRWQGRWVTPAAYELVTRPLRTRIAAMVFNGAVPGLRGEGLRIVLWDNVFRRGDGLADWYVLHELGHCTDFCFAFRSPSAWRAWSARLEAAFAACPEFLTDYAREAAGEYFAEGFACWATPADLVRQGRARPGLELQRWELDREVLRACDPVLWGLIEEAVAAVSNLLP